MQKSNIIQTIIKLLITVALIFILGPQLVRADYVRRPQNAFPIEKELVFGQLYLPHADWTPFIMGATAVCVTLCICMVLFTCMCIFSCSVFVFLFYKTVYFIFGCTRSVGSFLGSRTDHVITIGKNTADNITFWYKIKTISHIVFLGLSGFSSIYGAAFSGLEKRISFAPEGKHDRAKPFSYMYGGLAAVGILFYLIKGAVPKTIKEGLSILCHLPDGWEFYSRITAKLFDWFEKGHIEGCTCPACSLIRDATLDPDVSEFVKKANEAFDEKKPGDSAKIPFDYSDNEEEVKFRIDGVLYTKREYLEYLKEKKQQLADIDAEGKESIFIGAHRKKD